MQDWVAARKDFCAGLLILVLGVLTVTEATTYEIGSLRRMGPGFFPLGLGVIMALVGGLILLTARKVQTESGAVQLPPEWRGWICICASIAAFVVLGRYGGLVPATFAIVFIAALGDRQNSVVTSAMLAGVMTLLCVIVFWWLLKVAFPLFRWG